MGNYTKEQVEAFIEERWGLEHIRKMSLEERRELLSPMKFIDINPITSVEVQADGTKVFTIEANMNGDIYDAVMRL